jgi:hypothetical protein
MECSGAYAVFDGIGSPLTQTFGLGIFEELTAASLELIERFFLDRGAPVDHEISPLAGVAALSLLCSRQYRPIEISNVMYRPTEKPVAEDHGNIRVRVTGPEEAQLWTDTSTKAGHTNIRNFAVSFYKPRPFPQHVTRVRASSLSSMANLAPQAHFVFITELPYSRVRLQFQRCAVGGCKRRFFKSVCDTPSTTTVI